jgi:prepilin-type N-terminal cleavage/methylation domain-containing protein/prepilin-type processing-associated H-X9-DG protein
MKRKAFTLVELLVVIAIIGVLVAILVPAVSKGLAKSKRLKCMGNVRQIATAAQMYFDDVLKPYELPYVGDHWYNSGQAASNLLPYVDYDVRVFDCPANRNPVDTTITKAGWEFSPEIPGYNALTEYEFNVYICEADDVSGVRRRGKIYDYSSVAYTWDYPYKGEIDGHQVAHKGGINVAYLDGHAAWLADEDMGLGTTNEFFTRGHNL